MEIDPKELNKATKRLIKLSKRYMKAKEKAEKDNLKYYLELPYTIIIIPEEVGGFFAKIKELKGCMTQGNTWEEIKINIEDAKKLWLEVAIRKNMKIPQPTKNMMGWEKYKRKK